MPRRAAWFAAAPRPTQVMLRNIPRLTLCRRSRRSTEIPEVNVNHETQSAKLPPVVWLARHAETAIPTTFHGAESDVELGEHGKRLSITPRQPVREGLFETMMRTRQPQVVNTLASIGAATRTSP